MAARTNIVTAVFVDDRTDARTIPIWQYDYGQILQISGVELPTPFQVHFSNTPAEGESVLALGEDGTVAIPDALLLSGANVYAFVYLHTGADDGETVYRITIPVTDRPEPTSEEPTPVQQDIIDQAIAALQAAVQQTQSDVQSADQSAEDAEAWAVGKRGGEDVPETDETYHNNSKFYADMAEQAAATAGYMYMTIDGDGHLIYEKTDSVDVDFTIEDDGHLIVEIEED